MTDGRMKISKDEILGGSLFDAAGIYFNEKVCFV